MRSKSPFSHLFPSSIPLSIRFLLRTLSILLNAALIPFVSATVQVAEGNSNIVTQTIARNALHDPMLQISLDNPSGQPAAVLKGLNVTAGGTGNDATDLPLGGAELWWDKNADGRVTTGTAQADVLLGSENFLTDNGVASFTGFSVPLPSNSSVKLLVAYTLGPGATAGESFRARITQNAAMLIRDAATSATIFAQGAPVNGFTRTVGPGTLTIIRVQQTPDGAVAIPNRTLLPLIHLQLLADDVEDLRLNSIQFKDIGTADMLAGILPGTVRLFKTTAEPKITDQSLLAAGFSANDQFVTFTSPTLAVIPRDSSIHLWLTADMVGPATGVIGSSYQVQLGAAGSILAPGARSQDAPAIIGAQANGPAWQLNYNPLQFTLNSDLGAALIPTNATNFPVFSFRVTNDPAAKSESAQIRSFSFHASGSMNDLTAISRVKLYTDSSPAGKITAVDTILSSGTFSTDNGTAVLNFSANPITLAKSGSRDFIVGVDLNGTATNGQTLRLELQSRNDFQIIGDVSTVNSGLNPTPFRGAIKTIGQPRATMTLDTNLKEIPDIVAPEARKFPLLGWQLTGQNDEDLLMAGLHLNFTGPGNELNYFERFYLYLDRDGNGSIDPLNDTELASGTLSAAGADAVLDLLAPEAKRVLVARGQNQRFALYADIATTVIGDGSETFSIVSSADSDIIALGAQSGAQASYTSASPPFTLTRTIRNPAITVTNYPAAASVVGNINGSYGFAGVQFPVPSGEDLIVNRVRFNTAGSLDDAEFIKQGYAWNDTNRDLLISNAEANRPFDVHVWPDPVSQNDGVGTIELSTPGIIERTGTFQLSVGLGFGADLPATAQAQLNKTVTVSMVGAPIIEGVGARSGRPIEVTNASGNDTGRTLTFAKGTAEVTQKTVTRTSAPPNGSNIETFCMQIKTSIIENNSVDQFRLKAIGTINESLYIRPGGIKIYIDTNRNGVYDKTRDYLYAIADPPAQDNGTVTFTAPNYIAQPFVYSFPPSGDPYDTFLVTVDLKQDAPEDQTVQFQMESTNDLVISGAGSKFPFAVGQEITYPSGMPPFIGPSILIQRGGITLVTTPAFLNAADNKPEVHIAPQAQNYEVASLDLKATAAEGIDLRGFTLRNAGTANPINDLTTTASVKLYKTSINPNNLLTSGTFQLDGSITLTSFTQPLTLFSTGTTQLHLTFSGNGTGLIGTDFKLTLAGADFNAIGISSALPIQSLQPANPWKAILIRFDRGRLTVSADQADQFLLPIPTGQDTLVQRLKFAASRTEPIRLKDISVKALGTANETTALQNDAVILNGRVGTVVTPAGSAPFLPGDNGEADLRNLNIDINAAANTATKYSLDGALDPVQTVSGTTLRFDLTTTSSVRGIGLLTGAEVEIVFDDQAGTQTLLHAPTISGRTLTLSNGLVTLSRGSKNPANGTITGNEQNLPLMQIQLLVDSTLEGVTLDSFSICGNGSADESQVVGQVRLYQDIDNNGLATGQDVLLGSGQFNADNGTITFAGLSLTYPVASQPRWLIVGDLTGQIQLGETISVALCPPPFLTGTGQLTQAPVNVKPGSTPPLGAVYSLPSPLPTAEFVSNILAEETSGHAVLTVKLNKNSTSPVNVTWHTLNGTALAGQDYTTRDEVLTILPNTLTGTIDIALIDDNLREQNENFTVVITDVTNGVPGAKLEAQVTISDDPVPPIVLYLLGVPTSNAGLNVNSDARIDIADLVTLQQAHWPSVPATPAPSNGASAVPIGVTFDWANVTRATSYDFYLWRAFEAQPDTPVGIALTLSAYTLPVSLLNNTDYRWQVIARNASGAMPGPIWSFRTEGSP